MSSTRIEVREARSGRERLVRLDWLRSRTDNWWRSLRDPGAMRLRSANTVIMDESDVRSNHLDYEKGSEFLDE